ncbi:AAA family ATPase [Saccharothrix variisporea]|uniref:MoxR-like ATPase n=1 Tax=Saccharothrix variisporea TaxID=543527 RepID=A0A495XIY9_9PSEU|nr:MoxR family ATPase [Saccharothrix variisporea]RKT74461.1 MoxR-like ATPase [Saccharothrix variisporea]
MTTHPTISPEDSAIRFKSVHDTVLAEVERVLKGKTGAVRLALACVFGGGHLLIEDVPGTGKTSLAKAIATAVSGSWQRIQFTPDLLPGDITGVSVWDEGQRAFRYRPGPVFANVVLADEINRAGPKTQSALLEVMEEGSVTVDGVGHPVPTPFLVVATQNPIDLEGTYQLPEAQLDRFLMRISLGHPDVDVETALLANRAVAPAPVARPVTTLDEITRMREAVTAVHVAPEIARYIALLAQATRAHQALRLGLSSRGSIALLRAAQAHAIGMGRPFVVPDDVRAVAVPVVAHRLMPTAQAQVRGASPATVLREVLASVPAPAPMVSA